MKKSLRNAVATLAIGTAMYGIPAAKIVENILEPQPQVVTRSNMPMGSRSFYDTDGDSTLDKMVQTNLIICGRAWTSGRKEYSVETAPERFVKAQGLYQK